MRSTTSSPSWAEALNTDTRTLLGDRLRYSFTDQALLDLALTHRSWCAEHAGDPSNERLEFLGDSILGLVVAEYAFARFPDRAEGELSKIRASVVNATTLAEVAADLGLGAELRLGKGEESIGGRDKRSILSDAMEAVFGAIFLDGGIAHARELSLELLAERIAAAAAEPDTADFKSRLQEAAAHRLDAVPEYRNRGEGPDHAKVFFAEVLLNDEVVGRGEGRNKKEAEQDAARAAWLELFEPGPSGREREEFTNAAGSSVGADREAVVDLSGGNDHA